MKNSFCGEKGREKHALSAELAPVQRLFILQVVKIKFDNMDMRSI